MIGWCSVGPNCDFGNENSSIEGKLCSGKWMACELTWIGSYTSIIYNNVVDLALTHVIRAQNYGILHQKIGSHAVEGLDVKFSVKKNFRSHIRTLYGSTVLNINSWELRDILSFLSYTSLTAFLKNWYQHEIPVLVSGPPSFVSFLYLFGSMLI